MNACAFCKRGKRKCDKTRPSCSNCVRLRRSCIYTEDSVQTSFMDQPWHVKPALEDLKLPILPAAFSFSIVDLLDYPTLQKFTLEMVMQTFLSLDNVVATSQQFFTGTHQRVPALSKFRFQENLQGLATTSRPDFAALCLSIFLVEQRPTDKTAKMQSSIYFKVKHLITVLEMTDAISLDLIHSSILVVFYELGHGLHRAAYISIAACARLARVLGLHRKRWCRPEINADRLALEEEKRTWWVIVLMDRVINLCNGDALLVTNDPMRTDPLPIEDLFWSESLGRADIEFLVPSAPLLDAPFSAIVGQLARECQVSHLVGRVIRHVFDPSPDPTFNAEEAVQLERTLRAYLPVLSNEELKVGKYCGAYAMCNSALFMLYEYMLNEKVFRIYDEDYILQAIEVTALGALTFAEASHSDQDGNYPPEVFSPYLPYSLCQAAIVHYQLWIKTGSYLYKERVETLKRILRNFTARWMIGWQFLEIIDSLNEHSQGVGLPLQGYYFGSEGRGRRAR